MGKVLPPLLVPFCLHLVFCVFIVLTMAGDFPDLEEAQHTLTVTDGRAFTIPRIISKTDFIPYLSIALGSGLREESNLTRSANKPTCPPGVRATAGPTQPLNGKKLAEELQEREYVSASVPLCDSLCHLRRVTDVTQTG